MKEDIEILRDYIENDNIVVKKALSNIANELEYNKTQFATQLREKLDLQCSLKFELEKKDKVIEEMANYIKEPYQVTTFGSMKPKVEIIKEYFYKKIEECE